MSWASLSDKSAGTLRTFKGNSCCSMEPDEGGWLALDGCDMEEKEPESRFDWPGNVEPAFTLGFIMGPVGANCRLVSEVI